MAPPPAPLPPPAPFVVSPPAAPAVAQAPPPPVHQARRTGRPATRAVKVKKRQTRVQKAKGAAAAALPALRREEASSVDGTLLAGGLALFVLVLADTVFLTLSTGVFRGARTG